MEEKHAIFRFEVLVIHITVKAIGNFGSGDKNTSHASRMSTSNNPLVSPQFVDDTCCSGPSAPFLA